MSSRLYALRETPVAYLLATWLCLSIMVFVYVFLHNTPQSSSSVVAVQAIPPTVDLGIMRANQKKKCQFTLKNSGTEEVALQLTSTCGCIVIDDLERTLRPGDTVVIDAEVESSSKSGRLQRSIHAHYRPTAPSRVRRLLEVDITAIVKGE